MKKICRICSFLLIFSIIVQNFVIFISASEPQTVWDEPRCYQQTDTRWGNKEQIAPNGCGLLSLVNAVHYLTGNFIDPVELAVYAHEIDAYNGSVGGGTARWVLYHQLQNYEQKYGFKVTVTGKDANVKNQTLIDHLKSGGAAVAHVYGHFIALCGYDESNKTYLVYDSAANYERRGTTTNGDWLTVDELTTSEYMRVDWWCLIQKTCESRNSVNPSGKLYVDREARGYIRCANEALSAVTLSGSAYSSRGIKSMYYTVDHKYNELYPFIESVENGKDAVEYSETVDLTGKKFSSGEHIVRISAETLDGGICDVAEFVISVNDGNTGFTEDGAAYKVDMSGFFGQTNVLKKMAGITDVKKVYKMMPGYALDMGWFDLSEYSRVEIHYSTKETFKGQKNEYPVVFGLKSADCTYGDGRTAPDYDNDIICGEVADGVENGISEIITLTLDLSDIDYSGNVYLTSNIDGQYAAIRDLTFYLKDVPQEETTEFEETQPDTASETTVETEEPTSAQEGSETESDHETDVNIQSGCKSVISNISLLITLFISYFLMKRRNLLK